MINKILVSLTLLNLVSFSHAEYRSNLYRFTLSNEVKVQFDFSEISDTTFSPSDDIIKDLDIYLLDTKTFYSPYGIYDYGPVDFYYSNEACWYDKDTIAKYKNKGDSLIWNLNIKAPQSGYVDSIKVEWYNSPKRLLIVKTSESQHAILVVVAEYCGGINRVQYYWALQTDGSGKFQKDTPITTPLSIHKAKLLKLTVTENNIVINNLKSDGVIRLHDLRGRKLFEKQYTGADRVLFDISSFCAGVYKYSIAGTDGVDYHGSFLKR